MAIKNKLFVLGAIMIALYLAGCAATTVVAPTPEEWEAAKRFKKTVAVIEFDDAGSEVEGLASLALAKLEGMLVGHFNVVERRHIEKVLAERDFASYDEEVERYSELGKLLGADFLVIGGVQASTSGPNLQNVSSKDKEGNFYGRVWEDVSAGANVSVKMVDVRDGMIFYSDRKSGSASTRQNSYSFDDEASYKEALRGSRRAGQKDKWHRRYSDMDKKYSCLVDNALDNAIAQFNRPLRNKFAMSGQVLQFISEKEVLINLGSAYGVRPGQKLIVWEEKGEIVDPRTGMRVFQREQRFTLRVTKVTSGLTCVAKGSRKAVQTLIIGSKVYTH